MRWRRNEIEMFFDDVHCEKDRALGTTDMQRHLLGLDWVGVVVVSRTGKAFIRYSESYQLKDHTVLDFLNTHGLELFHQENSYPYRVFHHGNEFYDVIPIREEIGGHYVVFLLYGRLETPFSLNDLEWAAVESRLVYEKVLLENKATQTKEYLDHILNLSGIITCIFDRRLNIVSMSQMAQQLFGFSKSLVDVEIDNVDYLIKKATLAMTTEYNQQFSQKLISKTGSHILEATVGPFYDSTGLLVGGILIATDVTEKSIHEYEVEQRNLFSMIGNTAVMLAHDVNNPLMNIRACAQLLSHDNSMSDEGRQELLGYIIQESERIEGTISQLFSYATAVSDNEYESVQVNDILTNCISIIRPKATQLMVQISTDFDNSLPLTKAINLELQQVFVRIMFNSLGAMPEGGLLHIESNYHSAENCIVVRVIDTGIGISSENLKKIFKPYFTTKADGHGLGLYASKNIIERYGGKIAFDSEEHKGTTCTVYIPVA